jgi:hypothetical protein
MLWMICSIDFSKLSDKLLNPNKLAALPFITAISKKFAELKIGYFIRIPGFVINIKSVNNFFAVEIQF